MSEDWTDPFNADDAASQREKRRREREERRRARLGRRVQKSAPEPPAQAEPGPAPEPPPSPEPAPAPETAAGSAWAARRPAVPRARPSSRRRRIAVGIALLALIAVGVLAILLYQPFHGAGSGRVAVTIPKGASASQIADLLDRDGVVADSTFFRIRLSLSGKSSQIQAGRYTLASDMSYGDAIGALTKKPVPLKPKTTTVTIPEGYDRIQAADLLKQDGIKGDYKQATIAYKGFDPARYGAGSPANLEGFLFPATYKLRPGQTVDDLVGQQLAAFERAMKGVDLSYARSKNLKPYDVLTIASIIEREAQRDADRPKVAAVIYNRLHAGMPLQIDATIRFAENNYTKPLTTTDLQLSSPYNSYTNTGLPPGPISNPGLASIEAAAKPAHVPYLYYVTKPGACGKLQFATTYAQAQRDQAAYNNARNAAGGKSPTTC